MALRNILLNKLGGEFGQENIDAVFGSKGYIHNKWATIDSHPSRVQLSPNVMRLSGTGGDQLQEGFLPVFLVCHKILSFRVNTLLLIYG